MATPSQCVSRDLAPRQKRHFHTTSLDYGTAPRPQQPAL